MHSRGLLPEKLESVIDQTLASMRCLLSTATNESPHVMQCEPDQVEALRIEESEKSSCNPGTRDETPRQLLIHDVPSYEMPTLRRWQSEEACQETRYGKFRRSHRFEV